MCSRPEIIPDVRRKNPLEMTYVEDDDMVETLVTDGADATLEIGWLPRRWWGNEHLRDAEDLQPAAESFTVAGIGIAHQITGSRVKREGLNQLPRSPLGGRVSSDVKVQDLASLMPEHEEHMEDLKCHGRYGEEIDRSEVPDGIVEERPPSLRRWLAAANRKYTSLPSPGRY